MLFSNHLKWKLTEHFDSMVKIPDSLEPLIHSEMYQIISVKSFRERCIKNSRESGFEGSLFEKRDFMIVHDHDNLLKWSHKLALIILTFRFSNFLDWPGFLAFDDFLWSFYDAEKSFRLWSSIKMSLATFLSNQAMSDLSDSPIFLKQESDVTLAQTHAFL